MNNQTREILDRAYDALDRIDKLEADMASRPRWEDSATGEEIAADIRRRHGMRCRTAPELIFKTNEAALLVDEPSPVDYVPTSYFEQAIEMVAMEAGRAEKRLTQKQADAVAALTKRVDDQDSQIAELRDMVAALQDQVADLANDFADVERDTKVTALRTRNG